MRNIIKTSCNVLLFMLNDLTRYFRYILRLLTKPSTVLIHGVRLPLPDNCPAKRLRSLYSERHERRFALIVKAKLRPDDVVMEMGSGLGFISSLCAKQIGSQKIFTFEANPALIPFIKRVYSLNAVQPDLTNVAIGTSDSQVPFYVKDSIVSSSLIAPAESSQPVMVKQIDVNQAISRIKPTFIFSDIEGAEGPVFKTVNLEGVRVIAIELHRKSLGETGINDLIEIIEGHGFKQNRCLSSTRKKLFERIPC